MELGVTLDVVKRGADDEVIAIKIGVETILVVHKDEMAFIMSTNISVNGLRFVKYVKFCEDTHAAHDKMLHLVGKMVLKYPDSKYFGKPILKEHIHNGLDGEIPSPEQFERLMKAVTDAEQCYINYCPQVFED